LTVGTVALRASLALAESVYLLGNQLDGDTKTPTHGVSFLQCVLATGDGVWLDPILSID